MYLLVEKAEAQKVFAARHVVQFMHRQRARHYLRKLVQANLHRTKQTIL